MKNVLTSLLFLAIAGGCAVIDSSPRVPDLDRKAKWALLPIVNHTETAQAGLRAEAIAEALLRARGVVDLSRYPAALSRDALFEPVERKTQEEAAAWARGIPARYVVYGAVDEWRYKVGIDGEPAVGITLHIAEAATGKVLWSGAAARTGWSREALAAVAQKAMQELLGNAGLR